MPYYLHPKTYATDDEVLAHFNGATADDPVRVYATVIDARKGINPKTHTVTFIPDDDEQTAWVLREEQRFEDGTYIPVPWATKWGVVFEHYRWPEATRLHYPHLSITHPGLIAYTKNAEHGHHDRQTRVTPGRYLEEFWKGYKYGSTSFDAEFPDWIARCKAENLQLRIATDPDDIEKIYRAGPHSCMSPGPRIGVHPTRVYGTPGDLAVAYLGPIEDVSARAVVWPDRKRYVRIYGDLTLKVLLTQAGYTPGNFDGARIRRIFLHGRLVLPYIDGDSCCPYVSPAPGDANLLELSEESGEDQACETTGFADGGSEDLDEPDDDDPDVGDLECDHCGETYTYGSQHNGDLNRTHCDDCIESRNRCDHCDWQGWDATYTTADGDSWCDDCWAAHDHTCDHSVVVSRTAEFSGETFGAGAVMSCGRAWNEMESFTRSERAERQRLGVTHVCADCADGMQACQHCAALFPDTDTACTDCGLAVRCPSTLPLDFVRMRSAIVAMWRYVGRSNPVTHAHTRWFVAADSLAYTVNLTNPTDWRRSNFDTLDRMEETYARVYAEPALGFVDPRGAYFVTPPASLTHETEIVF